MFIYSDFFIYVYILNINIFSRHLKLEIALEIPASNEWKIEANNSAEQGMWANFQWNKMPIKLIK